MAIAKLKQKKKQPYPFILEELESMGIYTKPMFGCTAIYLEEKIVLILRQRADHKKDNGIWLATTEDSHKSLQADFPSMRSIELFGPGTTGWQVLPEESIDFEEAALLACAFVKQKDPRIGKVPKKKKVKLKAKK